MQLCQRRKLKSPLWNKPPEVLILGQIYIDRSSAWSCGNKILCVRFLCSPPRNCFRLLVVLFFGKWTATLYALKTSLNLFSSVYILCCASDGGQVASETEPAALPNSVAQKEGWIFVVCSFTFLNTSLLLAAVQQAIHSKKVRTVRPVTFQMKDICFWPVTLEDQKPQKGKRVHLGENKFL